MVPGPLFCRSGNEARKKIMWSLDPCSVFGDFSCGCMLSFQVSSLEQDTSWVTSLNDNTFGLKTLTHLPETINPILGALAATDGHLLLFCQAKKFHTSVSCVAKIKKFLFSKPLIVTISASANTC